jgi:peptide/nickel transport system permease protein
MRETLLRAAGYLLKRLGSVCLVLFGISSITFLVTRVLGNPVYLLVGHQQSPEIVNNLIQRMGLDRPLYQQYFRYMWSLLHGDLGISRYTFRPVLDDIALRLPATLELVLFAMVLVILLGIPLGILAAVRRGSWWDHAVQAVSQLGASVPNFWLGLLLIYFLFFLVPLFPPPLGRLDDPGQAPATVTGLLLLDSLWAATFHTFSSALRHLVLPGVTLAAGAVPATINITRDSLVQILASDFIRTPRAYGVEKRTVYFRYALKNALVPVTTVLAMTTGFLMSGTVLVETVYSWPGLGLYAVTAMDHFDYEPIIAVVLISALFYAAAYLVADVLHFIIDPRFRVR